MRSSATTSPTTRWLPRRRKLGAAGVAARKLFLLAAGFGLALIGGKRRGRRPALLLVFVLLRFLLFLVAAHLTFSHGVLPLLAERWCVTPRSYSTSLHDAMVAELFHHAGFQRGLHRRLHAAGVPAFVTGHARLRRQQRRAREAVIGALRAAADGAEQKIIGHAFSW